MSEKQLQFRVGLFVLSALLIAGVMVFQFGEIRDRFAARYDILAHFDSAAGVLEGSPVRLHGVAIGAVSRITLDPQHGGVLLTLSIQEQYRIPANSTAALQSSLLGDSVVEISPGNSVEEVDPATVLPGQPAIGMAEIAERMTAVVERTEQQLAVTMASFAQTSEQWRLLAANVNGLVQTNRGSLQTVVERTVVSLDEFSRTMQQAGRAFDNTNRVIGDPEVAENMRKAIAGLPLIVNETGQVVAAMRQTMVSVNGNLRNIEGVTRPLADHTTSIVSRLDESLRNIERVTADLRVVSQLASASDGSLRRFMTDPALYNDLQASSTSLALLLRNLEPVVSDLRVFTDKVARHPEVLGVGGALRPGSGLKDEQIRQAGFRQTSP